MSRQVTKLVKILMRQSEGLGLDARRDAQLNQCHFPSFLVKCSAFFLATGVNVLFPSLFFCSFFFCSFCFFVCCFFLSLCLFLPLYISVFVSFDFVHCSPVYIF